MTLIAAYQYKGVPQCFIFGDGLVTIDEFEPAHKVHLPIKGTFYNSHIGSNSYVNDLVQKVSIINPNLAIAWAGNLVSAKCICNDIYEKYSDKSSINFSDFYKYMYSIPNSTCDDCCIIGIVTDDTGKERLIAKGEDRYTPPLPDIHSCIVGGSGVSEFWRMKKNGLRNVSMIDNQRPTNKYQMAVNQSISDGFELLTSEMFSNHTLEQGYGGFYELAWNQGNGYKKLTDVLYGNVGYFIKDKVLVVLTHLYKYDVVSTSTVIRTISTINLNGAFTIDNVGSIFPSIIDAQNDHDADIAKRIIDSDGLVGCESVGLPDLKASTVYLVLHIIDGESKMAENINTEIRSNMEVENYVGTVPLLYRCHRDQTPLLILEQGTHFVFSRPLVDLIEYTAEEFMANADKYVH